MSLAETQELMRTMQELMDLLSDVETKTTELNNDLPRTKGTLATFKQLERVALRFLVVVRKMGLPQDYEKMLQSLSKILIMLNMIHMSFNMMQRGPLGGFMAIFSLTGIGMAMPSMLEGYQ